jgi:hypothetical protein
MRRALLALILLSARPTFAEETAAQIAHRARDQGSLNLVGLKAEMRLTNVEKGGAASVREVVTQSRKIDAVTHTITRFLSPPDVAGVALLVVAGTGGAPDQISLYLPKIRRARKIAQSDRGQPFMESEFSYADFSGDSVDEATSHREKDGVVNGKPVFVLSGAPSAATYKKVVASIDTATYVPMRVEYYDDQGLLKVYTVQKVELRDGRTLATEMSMENQRTGRKTIVSVGKTAPVEAPEAAFTERALERG